MAIRIKVTRKDVKAIVEAAYPDYRGRKISVEVATSYALSNYWDGGTRSYVVAYDLATGKVAAAQPATTNPHNGQAHATVEIPADVVLVEHTISCGVDCGITIYASPANMPRVLPSLKISRELAAGAAS